MSAHDPRVRPANPFVREGHVDKPGIVGSHWWNKELGEATALRSRRTLLVALAVSAGGISTLGLAAFALAGPGSRQETRRSLDVQRDFGWSFGATSETVAFDALYTTTYAQGALGRLVSDLTPKSEAARRWFSPALFQSPEALPRLPLSTDEPPVTRLAEALRPINTPGMQKAEAAGRALAELLSQVKGGPVALVFDLDGPEAIAAAAGAADLFEPVFMFDNWPHPRGVVPAHLTLAAAVYHQPRFVAAAATRKLGAPLAFVLDRKRLTPYADDATQFDNRWWARLPKSQDLVTLEVKRVLYVVPSQSPTPALRDVAPTLNEHQAPGIEVRALALDAFEPNAETGKVLYGGTQTAHTAFFAHYPWGPPAPVDVTALKNEQTAKWRPALPTPLDPADEKLGTTVVEIDGETGLVLGPRSGSYNRASGGFGG